MVAVKPDICPTGRYSITEIAELLQVSKQTVSNWMADGRLPFGIRRANNRRFAKGQDVLNIWVREY